METPPRVTHTEFMAIFEFCDTSTPAECKEERRMSDDEFDTKSGISRRLAILSKMHEALFGVPTKGCKITEDWPTPA